MEQVLHSDPLSPNEEERVGLRRERFNYFCIFILFN